MKFSFPSLNQKSVVGLDVGSCSVKAVELQRRGKGDSFELTHLGIAQVAPEAIVRDRVRETLDAFGAGDGHIFNLGHGILPETPVGNVHALVDAVSVYSQRAGASS